MDTRDTRQPALETKIMLDNTDYYKYIFKKTEKIVCAVFYMMRNGHNVSQNDTLVRDVEEAAKRVLDVALMTLACEAHTIQREVAKLKNALVALESSLRLAQVTHIIPREHLEVFLHEIDSVYRAMRAYGDEGVRVPLLDFFAGDEHAVSQSSVTRKVSRPRREVLPRVGEGGSGHAHPTLSRRDIIKDFLRDHANATIKDISQVVTNCSEKTIQRELIDMIKDNVVLREGERRWSTYRLA